MSKTAIMAFGIRSALGETNIVLDSLRRQATLPGVQDMIARLEKVAATLQKEACLVESRLSPTLVFGADPARYQLEWKDLHTFACQKDSEGC